MLIKDLPEWLQKIAEIRQKEEDIKHDYEPSSFDIEDGLQFCMVWDETIEGHEFWHEVDKGNIPSEYDYKVQFPQ